MPTSTTPKLIDCCVDRAAFSRADNSDHGTLPVSLVTVTARLGGGVGEPCPREDVVAVRYCGLKCSVWEAKRPVGSLSIVLEGGIMGYISPL